MQISLTPLVPIKKVRPLSGMRDTSISNIEILQNTSCVQKSKPWFHICNLHPVGCRNISNISMAEETFKFMPVFPFLHTCNAFLGNGYKVFYVSVRSYGFCPVCLSVSLCPIGSLDFFGTLDEVRGP